MNILRIIIVAAGAVMFGWFCVPAVFLNVLNSGNIVGMLAAAVTIAYGLGMKSVNIRLAGVWQNVFGKIFLCAAAAVLAAAVIFFVVITIRIISAVHNRPTEETTVVVLGCQVHPWGPSMMLEERLLAAKEYLEDNPGIKCIVSGGQGENEVMSEAECMYRWLTERGISADRIYMEDKSTSTRENLELSKEIIDREGLSSKITIVTNSFHQYRAGRIAKDIGLESYAVSAKSFKSMLPTYYVREAGCILYEIFMEGN